MCLCQAYGKSGVPNARGTCLVCGAAVWTDAEAVIDAILDAALEGVQRAHAAQAAVDALGAGRLGALTEDRCRHCGALVGLGVEAFHLGLCDACRAAGQDGRDA